MARTAGGFQKLEEAECLLEAERDADPIDAPILGLPTSGGMRVYICVC